MPTHDLRLNATDAAELSELLTFLSDWLDGTDSNRVRRPLNIGQKRQEPLDRPDRHPIPTEAAALKCVYLAIMSLDPTGKGQQRWSNRWKAALNAFEITFDGRLTAGRK